MAVVAALGLTVLCGAGGSARLDAAHRIDVARLPPLRAILFETAPGRLVAPPGRAAAPAGTVASGGAAVRFHLAALSPGWS